LELKRINFGETRVTGQKNRFFFAEINSV